MAESEDRQRPPPQRIEVPPDLLSWRAKYVGHNPADFPEGEFAVPRLEFAKMRSRLALNCTRLLWVRGLAHSWSFSSLQHRMQKGSFLCSSMCRNNNKWRDCVSECRKMPYVQVVDKELEALQVGSATSVRPFIIIVADYI